MDEIASQLVLIVVLLLLSAFFSSAETSLTTVNKHRIRSLAEEKKKRAMLVAKLIEQPQAMLSAILVGNNIVNLFASSLTTSLVIEHFHSIPAGVATGILTFVLLIFGEISPKSLATLHAEKIALAYAPFIYGLTVVLRPVVFLLNKISAFLLFLFRVETNKKDSGMTENELLTVVEVSHEEGVIESEERNMINNVVDFGDSFAKDVMVPRIDMTFASTEMSFDELRDLFREERYSRLPVYESSRDNVIGILNLKDLFFAEDSKTAFDIRKFLREPYFTYEFKKTSELLIEMRKASISIAVVLDEYGATAGLITLEDLLEEIVGEIRDEYDDDETDSIQKLSDSEYLANGGAKLDEINDMLGLELESEDYDSIAGHIIHLLDRLPQVGETVTEGKLTFTVVSMEKNRIGQVKIQINPEEIADTEHNVA